MTLLSVSQDIADEIGILRPTSLIGSSNTTARRMLACAKAAGEDLYRAHNWSILQREHDFETTADEENYAVPDDFGRMISETAWDRTQFRQMRGAVTPAQWQRLRSAQISTTGLTYRLRLLQGPLAGSVLLDPVPGTTGDDLIYEYISSHWCEDSVGTGQATWTADTDNFRIDTELFRLGLLWRTQKALGNDYGDDRNNYEIALRDAKVADLALPIVSMAQQQWRPYANLSEGDFVG